MVASHPGYAPDQRPNSVLDEDLLVAVADLRARGQSWDEVAKTVHWEDIAELRRAIRRDPYFPKALKLARREVEQEAEADGMARLRALTHSENEEVAKEASATILKYLSEKRRDATRLKVEGIRAEARMACAGAKVKNAQDAERESAELMQARAELSEEYRQSYERACAKLTAAQGHVYLWGGCHRIGGVEPDDTDMKFCLRLDESIPGRTIVWAVHPRLLGFDPWNGPFLPPPGCCPRPFRDPRTGRLPPDPYPDPVPPAG